jgi:tRNA pseudouridine32 synthase/23S rRNA pseudouridine746 synthase
VPALAHRLDRDSSGCLVLGRHRQALDRLGKLFASGRIEKTYWAIVRGAPPEKEGVIDLPLTKQSQSDKRWWMKVAEKDDPEALPARTRYTLMGHANNISWLEMYPETGRTHQLRVHAKALGCPIIGDRIYGDGDGMLMLHARAVKIPLYPKKDAIRVEAPAPAHMSEALRKHGFLLSSESF